MSALTIGAFRFFAGAEGEAAGNASTLGIGSTQVSEMDGMVMLYVPEGEFLMGALEDDRQAMINEKPQLV